MMTHQEAAELVVHNDYEWIHAMPDPVTAQQPILRRDGGIITRQHVQVTPQDELDHAAGA